MFPRKKLSAIFAAISLLVLASLACTIDLNMPRTNVKTGPTVTEPINVPLPEDTSAITQVEINFGGGRLTLKPGAADALIAGEAVYNVVDFKPEVSVSANRVIIRQGDLNFDGIPDFRGDVKNNWTLSIGEAPISLSVKAGAYEGEMELGGLVLHDLAIADGAAKNTLTFSQLNPVEMDTLRYETGASQVSLIGLGNANFSQMIFRSGAGDYTLDFTGDLARDARVEIQSGLSNVKIIVPVGVSAVVNMKGGLTNVDRHGEWREAGGYILDGDGPTLTISVEMGAGNLELRNQ